MSSQIPKDENFESILLSLHESHTRQITEMRKDIFSLRDAIAAAASRLSSGRTPGGDWQQAFTDAEFILISALKARN